mmetsp:Transcript_22025/g.53925  ORF Transcript_22025/g.53925 Transcript_22025/m.53925 type:complete len:398 (+) Transcript_22025:1414-2607(+)
MFMAVMMTDSPGSVRTMSAAALAASVAPSTAIPISAFFKAGASFTPSPVIPTICPDCCRTSTILYLSSGSTSANPSAARIMSSRLVEPVPTFTSASGASRILLILWIVDPIPSLRAVSIAIAVWSPVIILTWTPISCAISMVAFVSTRGGSKRERIPLNWNTPCSSVCATPNALYPRSARSLTFISAFCSTRFLFSHISSIWGVAPFVTLNFPSFGCSMVASVRFIEGSKGMKATCLYSIICAFGTDSNALFMIQVSIASCPSSSRFAASADIKKSLSASILLSKRIGSSSCSLLRVNVPVLSEHNVCIPASSSIAERRATMAFLLARMLAPTAIVTVATTCIAIGIDAMRRTTAVPTLVKTSPLEVPLSIIRMTKIMITRTDARAMRNTMTLNSTF